MYYVKVNIPFKSRISLVSAISVRLNWFVIRLTSCSCSFANRTHLLVLLLCFMLARLLLKLSFGHVYYSIRYIFFRLSTQTGCVIWRRSKSCSSILKEKEQGNNYMILR